MLSKSVQLDCDEILWEGHMACSHTVYAVLVDPRKGTGSSWISAQNDLNKRNIN